jgi:hypothetical protein
MLLFMPIVRHVRKTLLHKWFVLLAGLRTGAPIWRLVIHDWSKLLPSEALAYARHFCATPADQRPADFQRAWLLHQNRHPHHWEYWIPRSGKSPLPAIDRYVVHSDLIFAWIIDTSKGAPVTPYAERSDANLVTLSTLCDRLNEAPPVRMPEWAVREMVADWMGASRAYEGHWPTAASWPWWDANRYRIRLHPATRCRVEAIIADTLADAPASWAQKAAA